jgi:hypothetical protein
LIRQFVRLAVISGFASAALLVPALVAETRAGAQDTQGRLPPDDRVAASFVLARGRVPTAAEAAAWSAVAASPFSDLLARHRQELAANAGERRAVSDKADLDVFGEQPGPGQVGPSDASDTYFGLVAAHLRRLADHPEQYAEVVQRAYRFVLRRDAYPQELEYWKRYSTKPFVLLAACIDDWARRNQPGLTVTSGPAAANVNSRLLVAVRLSPAAAAEVRAAAGFARPRGSAAALGRHVIAPGAEDVASVGGVHFVATGAAGSREE